MSNEIKCLEIPLPERKHNFAISADTFANGQIRSKLNACSIIESYFLDKEPIQFINYASWNGMLPFLLLSRNILKFQEIILVEKELESLNHSRIILENWICESLSTKFYQGDCEFFDLSKIIPANALLVNTSCEHIENYNWLKRLPQKLICLIQSTNQRHATHVNTHQSLSEFENMISKNAKILKSDKIEFIYPNQNFDRFTILCEIK